MTLDLSKLKALASAATQSWSSAVWYGSDEGGWAATGPHHEYDDHGDEPGSVPHKAAERDARFIAALNPTTALALVERVEGLERECKRLRGVIESFASDLDGSAVSLLATELRNRTKAEEPK